MMSEDGSGNPVSPAFLAKNDAMPLSLPPDGVGSTSKNAFYLEASNGQSDALEDNRQQKNVPLLMVAMFGAKFFLG